MSIIIIICDKGFECITQSLTKRKVINLFDITSQKNIDINASIDENLEMGLAEETEFADMKEGLKSFIKEQYKNIDNML